MFLFPGRIMKKANRLLISVSQNGISRQVAKKFEGAKVKGIWVRDFWRLGATISCGKQKSPPEKIGKAQRIWQLPTLPHDSAVPSAIRGLTSLFGMGRGEHPWKNHHKKFKLKG